MPSVKPSTPSRPVFVSERIVPEFGSFDIAGLARGEPSVPRAFAWRDSRFEVARITGTKRATGEDRGDVYVRRHYYDVETSDALRMSLYFERNPSDRHRRKAWWLYTVTFPEATLETTRLLLRRWTYADRSAFRAMTQDPDVMRYLHDHEPLSDAEADAALTSTILRYDKDGFGDWALVLKKGGEPIGESGLDVLDDTGAIEIGWMLLPTYWGQGLALEAASAVKDHAFGVLGLGRLVARTAPGNASSIRLAQRLGMTLAGHVTHRGHDMLEFEVRS